MLQVIIDEVDRLDIVVGQFLDYARPMDLTLREEPLNHIVSRALVLLKAQGLPENLKVEEDLDPNLPTIRADAGRLSQVVTNLLRNALQALPSGGTINVSTGKRVNRAGQIEVEVVVRDSGSGIAPEDLDNLFIPFFTTKSEGTGLGLPISQRIVEAHHGDLEVQSHPGKGASFSVRIPLRISSPSTDPAG
jgi:signal transduction histidine kinase